MKGYLITLVIVVVGVIVAAKVQAMIAKRAA
jgi:hypothetical protein